MRSEQNMWNVDPVERLKIKTWQDFQFKIHDESKYGRGGVGGQ